MLPNLPKKRIPDQCQSVLVITEQVEAEQALTWLETHGYEVFITETLGQLGSWELRF